jgi:hypothetical protein
LEESKETLKVDQPILVAENDAGMHGFLQDYVKAVTSLGSLDEVKNRSAIYLLPSGFNSISSYLAVHDRLYRQ